MKIDKILVGIDFDINNSQLMKLSFEIAKNCNAQLTFLHCYHPSAADVGHEIKDPEKYHLQELVKLIDPVGNLYHEVDFGYEVVSDFAVEGILKYKNENAYDLLVLGKKKNDNWIPIKSNSIIISDKSEIPTIVIPEDYRMTDFSHVVFNLEFEFREIEKIYDLLVFCNNFGAVLSCVHVAASKDKEEARKNLVVYQKLFEGHLLEDVIHFELLERVNGRELEYFAKDNEVDLLALSKSRHTWRKQYLKSKEEKVSQQIAIPIMLLNF